MENIKKKQYEKPKVTRIRLDAQCAVLAVCKTTGSADGPGPNCQNFIGDPCRDDGS
jgi:hypothetical protein